jgi:predicted SprT family Zn-dependent metalloprotease
MVMNFNLKEAAHYDYLSNTIRINPRAIFRNDSRTNNAAIQTIMHELVHAVTVETLKNSSILRKEAQELLDQVKDALGEDAKYYGLSNIYEFLAELTSEDFVKKLT